MSSPLPLLPAAATLTGAELLYGVQNNGDVQLTVGQINSFVTGGGGAIRQKLQADINFYVATTGSDSNNGSVTSKWATLQHAANYVAENLDIAAFQVFINIGAGSFAGVSVPSFTGGGNLQFNGAGSANTNVAFISYDQNNLTTVGINKLTFNGTTQDQVTLNSIARIVLGDASTNGDHNDLGWHNTVRVWGVHGQVYDGTIDMGNGQALGTFIYGPVGGIPFGMVFCEFGAQFLFTGTWQVNNGLSGGWIDSGVRTDTGGMFVNNSGGWTGTTTGIRFSCSSASSFSDDTLSGINQVPGDTPGICDGTSFFGSQRFMHVDPPSSFGSTYFIDTDHTINGPFNGPDFYSIMCMKSASPHTVTVPSAATLGKQAAPLGLQLKILQIGTGVVTIAAGSGVTGNNFGVIPGGQWGGVTISQIDTDVWVMTSGI